LYHIYFNPEELFKGTVLQRWWEEGLVKKSHYYMVNLSDAARLCIIWKYGGFYTDLDAINIRALNHLLRFNGIVLNANAFLKFDHSNSFVYSCMEEVARNKEMNSNSFLYVTK
jgi:hypothetical protein